MRKLRASRFIEEERCKLLDYGGIQAESFASGAQFVVPSLLEQWTVHHPACATLVEGLVGRKVGEAEREMSNLLQPVPDNWTRGLAIVAHPDDLEYGASSAIAKWTAAGKQVTYVLATRGEAGIDAWPPEKTRPVREAEERESARLVGVDEVEFLEFVDGIVEYGLPLRRDLARAIRRHCPEMILISSFELTWPSGSLNQADHRAVGLAACDAARDAGNRWIFPELLSAGLEPWGGARWILVSGSNEPTHAVDVGDSIDRGIASLRAHRAYLENLSGEFDVEKFLREAAEKAGRRFGCQYAVDFRLLSL